MNGIRFDQVACQLVGAASRRKLLGLIAGTSLTWLGLDAADAKKRKKKHKKKEKCGKNGGKPVKSKCCTKTVNVDGTCRTCDVCPSGCAFSAVQPAIDAADNGDIIVICPGTFAGDLLIEKDLRLVGAGAGSTVLRGTGTDSVVLVDANTVELENLHVTNGNSMYGGGIQNAGSTLTLRNALVSENTAANSGGGIFNNDALLLIASEVRGNEAADGGGIFNNGAGTAMAADSASRVTGNSARNAGGGICNFDAPVILASCAIVSGNTPNNCAGDPVANCIN
jgi:hypothetical protein